MRSLTLKSMLVMATGIMIGHATVVSAQGADHSKALMETAAEFNKQLPKKIDETNVLLSTKGGRNKFTYTFQIPNVNKADVDIPTFNNKMTSILTTSVCSEPSVKYFRDLGIKVVYRYLDARQREISELVVDTKKC